MVDEHQVWKDGGRLEALGERRGPQYVHVDVLRRVSGGRLDLEVSMPSKEEAIELREVGVEGSESSERYGMKAWEPYCGSGSISRSRFFVEIVIRVAVLSTIHRLVSTSLYQKIDASVPASYFPSIHFYFPSFYSFLKPQ